MKTKTLKPRTKKATSKSEAAMEAEAKHRLTDGDKIQNAGYGKAIIGTKVMIDPETGQEETFGVWKKGIYRDQNFHKIWLMDFIGVLRDISTGKMRVVFYILGKLTKDNLIIAGTVRTIAAESETSNQTVQETIKILVDRNVMKRIHIGVYQLNPNLVFKGLPNARTGILIKYQNLEQSTPDNYSEADQYGI